MTYAEWLPEWQKRIANCQKGEMITYGCDYYVDKDGVKIPTIALNNTKPNTKKLLVSPNGIGILGYGRPENGKYLREIST